MKKMIAYVLLVLSIAAWGGIAALPLLDVSVGATATLTVALLIGGEIAFFVGVTLLGSEAWQKIKSVFRRK